jgi:hypothetical protein
MVNLAVNKRWLCSLVRQDSRQPAANAESDPTEAQSIDMRAVVYNSEGEGEVTGFDWRSTLSKQVFVFL